MGAQAEQTLTQAIQMAMESEKKAKAFYADAARNSSDPKGQDMFNQLAAFEQTHYDTLSAMLGFVEGGGDVSYAGGALDPKNTEAPSSKLAAEALQTDIDALSVAIEAERKARDRYQDLAAKATDQKIADLFTQLSKDEELHRKVLNDQFVALSNQGYWTWGE